MFQCRSSTALYSWIPFVLLALVGCESTPRQIDPPDLKDDFGASLERQPITAESVGEREMLHRRWQLDLKGQAAIPTGFFQDNGFEVGPSAGVKVAIEVEKNLFVGIDFDWANWKQKDGVSSSLSSPSTLSGVTPDQLFEDLDRYNFLLSVDYDWTIARSFIVDKHPLKWRLGLGVGGTLIEGNVDATLDRQVKAAGSELDIVPYVGFCARFGTGLRWQASDSVILFTQASYDLVYPFTMEVRIDRNRSEVDGDIDFGSINLGAGIAFEF